MKLSEFDYPLSKSQIAQYPVAERDSSRLLVIQRREGEIKHRLFKDIVNFFQTGDVLVLNDTRVIPGRLHGRKPGTSGGKVEILLLEELCTNKWKALVKGIRQGRVILGQETSALISRSNGFAEVRFESNPDTRGFVNEDVKNHLSRIGVMPLPPYIKRKADQSDTERYQTVYAKKEGAIAAPTAGLHFTSELLGRIKEKGVKVRTLTLHVGYGTFKPVLTTDIKNHQMDDERYEISENTVNVINHAKSEGRRIVAVGTTVTRALEASVIDELTSRIKACREKTSIFIYPGYRFKIIDALKLSSASIHAHDAYIRLFRAQASQERLS